MEESETKLAQGYTLEERDGKDEKENEAVLKKLIGIVIWG